MRMLTVPAPIPHTPITKSTLKTADPKIVPTPMSPFVTKTPKEKKKISLEAQICLLILSVFCVFSLVCNA